MKKIFQSLSSRLLTILSVLLLVGAVSPSPVKAQTSQGTDFWICFPANTSSGARELYITAGAAASVNIQIPGLGYSNLVNIPAGTLATVTLPGTVDVSSNGTADNKGIHITSDNPVTVYGMNQATATTDAFLALPVDALGTDYLVMGYTRDASFVLYAQMTIVATQDNTSLTITPTATGGGFTAGVPGNVVLNQGQVFQLRSNAVGADYTGSHVVSDKPVAVFGGNECTNISGSLRACDHLVEQMVPTSGWGRSFLTVPLATRLAGDVFRVLAQQAGTQVSVNGSVVANLNYGQFHEMILASNTYNRITSNNPILVGQYSRSSDADGVTSDPFFALVPPDEQFLNNYIISAGTGNIPNNYLNITSPTANTGTVLVDGNPVVNWTPIPSTTFSGAQVSINNGIHTITSNLPIGLLVYGFGNYDSYGYIGGQAFAAVATINALDLTPTTGTAGINNLRCWEAEVTDSNGDPVSGIRVDFTITGANPGAGFAFTDANGIATYCYTGTNAGQDVIVATTGALADTAQFTWTDQSAPVPVSNWALFIGLFLIIATVIWKFRRS
ncbi:MAG: Ig-like domain-containing protein [Bacteroidales bacterium]|nr:Ig-like domain-containing protein [Bacteroidales bacterium]